MRFDPILAPGIFKRRYKRFLAEVVVGGESLMVHCPNTGSMRECLLEGSPCWLSKSANPKRKTAYTWELATTSQGDLACIHSARANAVVEEALLNGLVEPLAGFDQWKREVPYGERNSRVDFVLFGADGTRCFVEVKSVTLKEGENGYFPDSVSVRGQKHLRELMAMKALGHRAVLFFCVLNSGIESVSPADHIDEKYGEVLREAMAAGVEVLVYGAAVTSRNLTLNRKLPLWV